MTTPIWCIVGIVGGAIVSLISLCIADLGCDVVRVGGERGTERKMVQPLLTIPFGIISAISALVALGAAIDLLDLLLFRAGH